MIGILLKVDTKYIDTSEVVSVLNEVEFNGSLKFGSISQSLPIALIVAGGIIVLLAGLGMFGACCKNRCMLITVRLIIKQYILNSIDLLSFFCIVHLEGLYSLPCLGETSFGCNSLRS